jgi:protein-disulfide isomerase
MMRVPFAAALIAGLALSACQPKAADPAFGAQVRAYLLEHPEVIEEAVQKLRAKQMLEQARANAADVARFRQQLEADPRDLVVNPKGRYTVVEFFDYRCGYCKLVTPEVVKLIAENPDVRFVFKEFPIFGEVSDTAARMALTPQVKAKGYQLYKAWMADRGLDEAALDRHLTEAGLDPAEIRRAAASPEIASQLQDVRVLAKGLGLQGTPAFVVGDYLVPSAEIDIVRAALAKVKGGALKPGSPT